MFRKLLVVAGGLAVLTGLLMGAALMSATRSFDPPDIIPGYRSAEISVPHRDVPLPVHVWYAATEGTPELIGQNALFYGHYIRRDAPLPETAPVVLLSHGSGGNAVQMGWLAAHLANRGSVVIATNHPGTTSRDSVPARTVQIWERPNDLSALLDWLEAGGLPGFVPGPDVTAVGFSLGGHSALALAGLRVSKARFIEYCDRNTGRVDCGWLQAGGVDFAAIDASLYDSDHSDPRVTRAIAIDPALPQAATAESLAAMPHPVLIVNLGDPARIPDAMRADTLAAAIPGAQYAAIGGAAHFSALPRCSLLGGVVIGLAGDDNICSDRGLRERGIIHTEIGAAIDAFLSGAPVRP